MKLINEMNDDGATFNARLHQDGQSDYICSNIPRGSEGENNIFNFFNALSQIIGKEPRDLMRPDAYQQGKPWGD